MSIFGKLVGGLFGEGKPDAAGGPDPPRAGMNRRSFLVTLQGVAIGMFALPALQGQSSSGDGQSLTRKLYGLPIKKGPDDDFFLLYLEEFPDGRVETMVWRPETPEEAEEAIRFYNACRGVGPDAPEGRRIKAGPAVERSDEENHYLQAIVATRHSSQAYLDYANWLDAKGDPQGEFIRVSVAIRDSEDENPERESLNERWNELIDQHANKWIKPLLDLGLRPEAAGEDYPPLWLHWKGLVTDLEIDRPGVLPELADRLFAAAPVLRSLELVDEGIDVARVASLPQMAQIEELTLGGTNVGLDALRAVVTSPYLGKVRKLEVSYSSLGPAAGVMIAASPILGHLEHLNLRSTELGDDGVRALVASPGCRGLTELSLGSNELTAEGCRAVLASPHLGSLVELELGGDMEMGAIGAQAFPQAAFRRTLCDLDLSTTFLGEEGARHLALAGLDLLRQLNLRYSSIGAGGLRALLGARFFPDLYFLHIGQNDIGDEGAVALADANCVGPAELFLDSNNITDVGLIALSRSTIFGPLTKLSLASNPITAAGLRAFAKSEAFPNLEELNLMDVKLGESGCQALARSPHLGSLERLSVSEENLGKRGQKILVDHFGEDVVKVFD